MVLFIILIVLAVLGYAYYQSQQPYTQTEKTLFNEIMTSSKTPILEYNSAYGTSDLRDEIILVGSGSKDDVYGSVTSGELLLSTGTNINSSATIFTKDVGRYIPGYSSEIGMGIRFEKAPTGGQVCRWGGLSKNENEGIYWCFDAEGIGVVIRKNGVEKVIHQKDWNVDKADGKGSSKIKWELPTGYIYHINYSWYGYGQIDWSIISTVDNHQIPVLVHEEKFFKGTSFADPNLQLFQEVENGNTPQDIYMYIGGRQFSILGNYIPRFRFTGEARNTVAATTTVVPLISFRTKANYNNRSIKLDSFSVANTSNANSVNITIRIGGTLTGASWGTPTGYLATETCLESDISATAITGGYNVYAGTIAGPSRSGTTVLDTINLDIPEGLVITLCANGIGATANVDSGFRVREEW